MLHSIRQLRLAAAAVVVGLLGAFATAPAWSAAQRTFVASFGLPANTAFNCSLAKPCRAFNEAISVTSPGGEVVILDTAGYGPMVITQSIKIIGPSGVYGGISVLGSANPTTGIVINAGSNDVITLRGLDISGVPGAVGPFPQFGIDIQNAGVVHIEKSSIGNFTQPTGACINFAPTAETYVQIDDSFLRECRTGINANGTAVPGPGGPAVIVDNTRIEFGRATSGPAYGLWVHGNMSVSVRNSLISLWDVSIQMDNLPTNGKPLLELSQTKLAGAGTCLNVASSSAGGVPAVYVDGSQFLGCDDGIVFSHTAAGTAFAAPLKITDSKFEHLNNGGITLSTGSDAAVNVDLVRSMLAFTGNTGISLAAGGTSGINFNIRDTTVSNALTLLKTSGTSGIQATLIRSHLHNSQTAVDHGLGKIRMEQTTVTNNQKSLVNNGSPLIFSAGIGPAGTNFFDNNVDPTDGTVYITPTIIPMK